MMLDTYRYSKLTLQSPVCSSTTRVVVPKLNYHPPTMFSVASQLRLEWTDDTYPYCICKEDGGMIKDDMMDVHCPLEKAIRVL